MTDVQRFTTDYVLVEDRIRLAVERKDGSVQILWLTRPLLNKLAAKLVKTIDATQLPGAGLDDTIKSTTRQRFNQQAAQALLKPQKPVRTGTPTKQAGVPMLVTSIDLRNGTGAMNVNFKGGTHVLQSIPLNSEAIRQWLGVLHKCYCRAGWGVDFWPNWLASDQPSISTAHMN